MRKARKIAIGALSLTMAATIAASQVVAFANKGKSYSANLDTVRELSYNKLTGSIDLSDVARSQLADNVTDYGEQAEEAYFSGKYTTKTIIVNLDTPSIVESIGNNGTVAEFLATAKGRNTLQAINNSQNEFLKSLSASAISYKLVNKYSTVTNAVAIEVNTSKFNHISKMSGVSSAGISLTYTPLALDDAQTNYSNVYGTGIYDSTDIINNYGFDGSGVTVAILDTGLDYTHEAFTSYLPDSETLGLNRDDVKAKLELTDNSGVPTLIAAQRSSKLSVSDVYISDKVPFAYDYSDNDADVYPSYSQHGTHVAGIVAGKADTYIDKDGHEQKDFSGVAPNAQLVICKVFTDDLNSNDLGGARSEDIVAALDDCVTLGVDIINMSLGTTSGFSEMDDDDVAGNGYDLNRVYKNIKEVGISLIAAAGNEYSSGYGSDYGTNLSSNPDSGTVGSPSTFAGAMSVASVNGQKAPYMVANPGENSNYGNTPIFYNESNNANAVAYNFAEELLGNKNEETFTYLVIPGTGSAGDYSTAVRTRLANKETNRERILVVVRRGTLNFQDKVEIAWGMGADGIIVYNNVSGMIRMSLGDIDKSKKRIPAVSVSMDAGSALTVNPNNPTQLRSEGKITINKDNLAGPFMNDYSSWGATPDLKLKPDITSHGGEITSAVSGGYEQMSGTSMATPNLAGLMALVKNYLRDNYNKDGAELTTLTNQIVMSSATLLYDENHKPYSPRKQGAGLATLSNIFSTRAYLSTKEGEGYGTEDNRPKIELGQDKTGEYNFTFYVTNFGDTTLNFQLVSRFFTETLSGDRLAVAQSAYMLDDIAAQFKVNDKLSNGSISVGKGEVAKIDVTLKLSQEEKDYISNSFKNGMYVEGFISLVSGTDGQCDLNLPFMGFYGDWESAPMLDYNAYEISAIEQDTSLNDNEKPKASVYATQLYSTYYNGRYALPLGSFAYLQNENAEQKIYTTEEYCAISRFNIYNGATDTSNYLTSTGIRALYAGLLRNAELITYDIYNVDTGELVYQGRNYSVGKAYANGGSARPALVDMKLDSDSLGFVNNAKYEIEFNFYMKTEHEETMKGVNTFSSTFYIDYDAPILQNSRIRYQTYQENNKTKQRVLLDLDIYDNHYPQAVLLCYSERAYEAGEAAKINLATEYVTPVINPVRNATNTVTINITDIYENFNGTLYIQVDDYALNHNVYSIDLNSANAANQGESFKIVTNDRVKATQQFNEIVYNLTLEKNELYKVELDCGTASPSNYQWLSDDKDILIKLKDGEIFGLDVGKAEVTIKGTAYNSSGVLEDKSLTLYVTVVDSTRELSRPNISFGLIKGVNSNLQMAVGNNVKVNAGQTFELKIITDPWYYPVEKLDLEWVSENPEIATVTQSGIVTTQNKRGSAVIRAYILENGNQTQYSAVVTLNVVEPFDISNTILNHYYGSEEIVFIPNDENVMYIGEEAFEDNNTMRVVVIPKTVTEISARAFINCTALEEVYFISSPYDELAGWDTDKDDTAENLAALNLILEDAFSGCNKLRLLDLTNVKVITVGDRAFMNCVSLQEIRHMEKIGIASNYSFRGCTSLGAPLNGEVNELDLTGLHTSGSGVFFGCTAIEAVKTGIYTVMGEGMFYGCTSLKEIVINNSIIPGSAFENCTSLAEVSFGGSVLSIGDYAFANTAIKNFKMPKGNPTLGDGIFAKIVEDGNGGIKILPNTEINIDWSNYGNEDNGAVYNGTTLVKAPSTITSTFQIKEDTKVIGAYAFADCTFENATITIPSSVKEIGEGAFARTNITRITIPSSVTTISAYAFLQSALEEIKIPANVTRIGEGAFAECANLAKIDFDDSSLLKSIDDGAFSGTAIVNITLPDGVETMGNMVFFNCTNLVSAILPSIKSLGGYTFEGCSKLQDVTFGANATSSGYNTFFPGYIYDEKGNVVLEYDSDNHIIFAESSLTTVNLGGLTSLSDGVFAACTKLTTINLANVTIIGDEAFANCYNLVTVENLDKVTDIGSAAFAETKLAALNLAAAKNIGAQAFINVGATSLTIPNVEKIGAQAFAGINIESLSLPATLKEYGDGAFMAAGYLKYVSIDKNSLFFAENNVLYRNVTNARTGAISYELCLYPAGLQAISYTVKEGTSILQAYSFAYANYLSQTGSGVLDTVTLPYSVKAIGSAAFYGCYWITTYNFESIEAPRLLSEYWDTGLGEYGFNSLYYQNFYDSIMAFIPELFDTTEEVTLTIGYPSNGTGYDNYIFSHYFGTKVDLGELKDDRTRELINLIDSYFGLENIKSFDDLLSTIQSWNNSGFDIETNKDLVFKFCDNVKNAHSLYNNLASAKQRDYFSDDRLQKLSSVEEALKSVKARFNYPIKISSVIVSSTSNHKSTYKVGEYFDLTGLILEVGYDDFTSELISDISEVNLRSTGTLHSYDNFVSLEYKGIIFRVSVTVTEDGSAGGTTDGSNGGSSSKLGIILGSVFGGIGLLAAAAVVTLVVIKTKRT